MDGVTWVVISDKHKTRIFEQLDPPAPWKKIKIIERNASHGQLVLLEAQGPTPACPAYFGEVADFLRLSQEQKLYDELFIVAGPQSMGELKDHLDKETLRAVKKTIIKDLAHFTQAEIEDYLLEDFKYFGKVN